jgi:hypothetical protein
MNGDDHPDSNDYKEISHASDEQIEAWRDEARSLLEQIRNSRICVFVGKRPRRRARIGGWLDCLQWADGYDTLICFEPRRGKAAIRADFEELEEHLAHNHHHVVGIVTITSARQETRHSQRDEFQQPIYFPDTGVVWHMGDPEPDRVEKKWLHSAEVSFEIRRPAHPPHQGHIRVLHVGFSSPFAWVTFMLPHGLKAAMVIADPPPL